MGKTCKRREERRRMRFIRVDTIRRRRECTTDQRSRVLWRKALFGTIALTVSLPHVVSRHNPNVFGRHHSLCFQPRSCRARKKAKCRLLIATKAGRGMKTLRSSRNEKPREEASRSEEV